ncbi:hypothetical protein MBANPS3_012408 [Mucor bainieri]
MLRTFIDKTTECKDYFRWFALTESILKKRLLSRASEQEDTSSGKTDFHSFAQAFSVKRQKLTVIDASDDTDEHDEDLQNSKDLQKILDSQKSQYLQNSEALEDVESDDDDQEECNDKEDEVITVSIYSTVI